MGATMIAAFLVLAVWLALCKVKQRFFRGREMFGYFEYEYNGIKGNSREYGAMLELDCVGAMEYRRECGARITFEYFDHKRENIEDMIDKRYHVEQQLLKGR